MILKGTKFQQIYKVDKTIYRGFIALFQDNNPLHTNNKFAQDKGFKSKVMHGNILNGFISHFVGECLPTRDVIIYEQEISFTHPVYLNDSLNLFAEVEDFFESVQTIEFKFYFQNQDNIKIARGKFSIRLI